MRNFSEKYARITVAYRAIVGCDTLIALFLGPTISLRNVRVEW
jgi:hypothetical protein